MPSDRKWTGIYRHGAGWKVVVSQGRDKPPILRQFPYETPVIQMQDWRQDEIAKRRLTRKARANAGTFQADARRYLKAVAALPTFKERERQIELWIVEFGTTQRDRIRASDIRTVRDRWLTAPRGEGLPPVAPHTVNLRLRALSNLWTVLDGRAENPVRDVPEAPEPSKRPRALPFPVIEQILNALPDRGVAKKHGTRPDISITKTRLRVLAYTGWPKRTLETIQKSDVNFTTKTARLPDRKKGDGAESVTVELTSQAIAALKSFDALNLWGQKFSAGSMSKSLRRALKTLNLSGIRAYDLRHSYLALLARVSKDERAVQAIAQHRDIRTTRGYTEGVLAQRMSQAVSELERHFGTTAERNVRENAGKRRTSGTTNMAIWQARSKKKP